MQYLLLKFSVRKHVYECDRWNACVLDEDYRKLRLYF